MKSFAKRLEDGFRAGKRLSVGIDPHDSVLEAWGLNKDARGAESFARQMVAAAAESALCVKPQIAFFERFGSAGYAVLERIFDEAKQADLPVIADVKRGDIGSTFDAYAESWLLPGSPLEADAMTVVAYQGFGVLERALELANTNGKGVFVLAATSNPEAAGVQKALIDGEETVAASMVRQAVEHNDAAGGTVGNTGVVLGATLRLEDFKITDGVLNETILPVLAPGFGHQGATLDEAAQTFGSFKEGLIVHESRSLTADGPDRARDIIANHAEMVRSAF